MMRTTTSGTRRPETIAHSTHGACGGSSSSFVYVVTPCWTIVSPASGASTAMAVSLAIGGAIRTVFASCEAHAAATTTTNGTVTTTLQGSARIGSNLTFVDRRWRSTSAIDGA